jgi:hypothetical protein
MREDEADIRIAPGRAAEQQAGDGAGRVGTVFDDGVRHTLYQVDAALIASGVRVQHRFAAVQFLQHRRHPGVAEPVAVAGEHRHAIGFQHVQGIGDFGQGARHVRHRQGRKAAETPRIPPRQAGCIFVAGPRHLPRLGRVAEPQAGRGD